MALNSLGHLVRVLRPGQLASWQGQGQGKAGHWHLGRGGGVASEDRK